MLKLAERAFKVVNPVYISPRIFNLSCKHPSQPRNSAVTAAAHFPSQNSKSQRAPLSHAEQLAHAVKVSIEI
jgi:hypothetical protein